MAFSMVQGDLEPDMVITCKVNGVAEDLTDVDDTTMLLHVLLPDGTTEDWELVTEDLAAGQVKRVWETGNTSTPGIYNAQVKVQRGNGETQTFPSTRDYVQWEVIPALG